MEQLRLIVVVLLILCAVGHENQLNIARERVGVEGAADVAVAVAVDSIVVVVVVTVTTAAAATLVLLKLKVL